FDSVCAVLERIFFGDCVVWKLSQFPYWSKCETHLDGHRRTKYESSRLYSDNHVRLAFARISNEAIRNLAHCARIGQDRQDIFKDNSRLGKVGNITDQSLGDKLRQIGTPCRYSSR